MFEIVNIFIFYLIFLFKTLEEFLKRNIKSLYISVWMEDLRIIKNLLYYFMSKLLYFM